MQYSCTIGIEIVSLFIIYLQIFDPPEKLTEKVATLCSLLSSASYVVVHTGAGISTSAGRYALCKVHTGILCSF